MKAIYLNLDGAIAAVLAGETPAQPQVPLAVTIPAGQSVAVFNQSGTATKTADTGSNVSDIAWAFSPSLGDAIATDVALGLSQVLASESASVYAVAGDSFTATAEIYSGATVVATIKISVLVRRETASGPVDLVDFTPPAALTADAINTALVAAGPSALAGVYIDGAKLSEGRGIECELHGGDSTTVYYYPVGDGTSITDIIGNVSSSN